MSKPTREELLRGGAYARKQFFCKDRVIAWSHARRFEVGRRLVAPFRGQRLLDYGCGDGSFLATIADLFPDATGMDLDPREVRSCQERFREELPGIRFVPGEALAERSGAFDVITCMEVLEHCIPEVLASVLRELERLLVPGGRLVVSVPVEVGPSLLVKEALRTVAAWRGLGDYRFKERYTPGELLRMVLAGEDTAIDRPVYREDPVPGQVNFYHGHKGFNWRALRRRLRETGFAVEETRFSPVPRLGGVLGSQAWLSLKRVAARRPC